MKDNLSQTREAVSSVLFKIGEFKNHMADIRGVLRQQDVLKVCCN
jgi:hypothetical protein